MLPDRYSKPEDSDPTYTLDCDEPFMGTSGVAEIGQVCSIVRGWQTNPKNQLISESRMIQFPTFAPGISPTERAVGRNPEPEARFRHYP